MNVLLNIIANSVRRQNLAVMADKVIRRLTERDERSQREDIAAWCRSQAESWDIFASRLDASLWEETGQACALIASDAQAKLDRLTFAVGGPGHYPLLYFLTRYVKPQTAVETGVAAGWSSVAILTAMMKNDQGHLYSSDFPYFRLENPEKYIGYVVDNALRKRWTLLIDGDKNNLPKIVKRTDSIDLFHYDSDKSRRGREFAWNIVRNKLSSKAVVLFDDIQDSFHFRDIALTSGRPYRVFAFGGKYVGMIADE